MKTLFSIFVAALVISCAKPQAPVRFPVQTDRAQALTAVRGALAERGIETERIDEEAGIVHTRWVDTGFMYGEVQHQTATIVRRYTVIISSTANGQDLTLRVDAKRCAQGGFQIGDTMVTGACEHMQGLVAPHQRELDDLGMHLRSRIQ